MSEILNLAEAFRQKSEKQAASIGQEVQNEYKKHAQIINQCLSESRTTLEADILESHKRLKSQILSGWLWFFLTIMLLLAAITGVLFFSGEWIADNIKTLKEQAKAEQTLTAPAGLKVWRDGDKLTILAPKGWVAGESWTSKTGHTVLTIGTKKALEKK